VVFAAHDQQEWAAPAVADGDPGRRVRVEVGRRSLEQRLPGSRNGPAVIQLLGLLLADRVAEPYRNCSAVSETARCLFAGFLNTGNVARSDDSGNGSTPLICAASIATAPTARSWPSSFCAIMPPKECPMRMGFTSRSAMIFA
jgi:hypothetical protein